MKTFLITTIAFFAFALTCNAQWTAGPGNINNTNSGNVGIGRTDPQSVLDVRSGAVNSTSGQEVMRLSSNYDSATIGSGALLSFASGTNNIVFGQIGSRIEPASKSGLSFSTYSSSLSEKMRITADGNVGIGTAVPFSKFQIGTPGGSTTVSLSNDANIFGAYSATRGNLNIGTTDVAATDKGGMMTFSGGTGQVSDPYYFAGIRGAKEAGGTYKGYLAFYTVPSTSILTEGMRITSVGNVGIGTINPDAKLAVLGTIHSTSVLVDTNVPTPDYVFKSDYKLPTLSEIKAYTDKNHHLPGIPSAAEFEKNGINLGEMNMALLKKVEELTLYLMEKDKLIKALEQQALLFNTQQKQIDELKKSLDSMNHKKSK